MKKNIEWLKKEFDKVVEFRKQSNPSSNWGMGSNTVLKYIKEDFKNLINQLDEPELPVIPKFVADFIKVRKGTDAYSLQYIFCTAMERSETDQLKKEYDWIRENDETFARAWLDGFTVEEEQKYIVVLGKSIYNTTTYGQIGEVNSKKIMQSIYASKENIITPNQYTKSEILEVKDGEDIFKRYAVKVEELEE